jgi:2-methylisocitrate lyase-like PEP mutase family enzyme
MSFKKLHEQNNPLVICNVWDVASVKSAEKLNFQAIGTSSAAIATMLGYEDGEQMSFSELTYIVKRIIRNTELPVTVDIETGYSSDPKEIASHIKTLSDLGVVGINIEDSNVLNERTLINADDFAKKLSEIKKELAKENVSIFINVRTDTFLLGIENTLEECVKRIKLYESVGADGVFVPCIEKEEDIIAVVKSTALPVNVMCMPNLPDFNMLSKLGVKRISMGNFMFNEISNHLESTLNSVLQTQSFKPIF